MKNFELAYPILSNGFGIIFAICLSLYIGNGIINKDWKMDEKLFPILSLSFIIFVSGLFLQEDFLDLFKSKELREQKWKAWYKEVHAINLYDAEVLATYLNGAKDTFNITVYADIDNIRLNNQDLSYAKWSGNTGGEMCNSITVASSVRTFKILKNTKRTIE